MSKRTKHRLSVGVVHGIKAIRKRAAAGQPMKAWPYYSHMNMWDAFEPFVQEAHDDRLELLDLLDGALARLREVINHPAPLGIIGVRCVCAKHEKARATLARLREKVPA